MQIHPFTWDEAQLQIENLGEQAFGSPVTTTFGMASFPAGVRQPAEGFVSHDGMEVSFILDGEFEVETPRGTVTVNKDSLVTIPAGEPHATKTITPGRVVYFLITENKE